MLKNIDPVGLSGFFDKQLENANKVSDPEEKVKALNMVTENYQLLIKNLIENEM